MKTLTQHIRQTTLLEPKCRLAILLLLVIGTVHAQSDYLPDNMDSVGCTLSPEPQPWSIVQGRSSEFRSHMYAQPLVGDIDNDGRSEVVTAGYQDSPQRSSSIVIYDDQLHYITTISTPQMLVYGGYPIAIADADRDGYGEIFIHAENGYLYCYRFDGTSSDNVWISNTPTTSPLRSAILIVADINGDGHPVLWALNKIYNAVTGEELITLPDVIGQSNIYNTGLATMPVFADYDNDGILELAGGNKIYKLHINNYSGTTGNTAELWRTISGIGTGDGLTSTADIDLDGYLDIVVVRTNYMYAWKPYSGVGSNPILISSCYYPASISGSRALIADVNNDGYPEILFSYASGLTGYRYDPTSQALQQMWQRSTSDESGATTMTAFDFNLDGNVEVVYRDQSNMRIIDGTTGNNQTVFDCLAPTASEYPVVVDLERNGQAVIITSHNIYEIDHSFYSQLIVFQAPPNTTWAPARYVWNQHAYNTVNISNDLTVPTTNFNPATPFTDPDNVVRRPFNNFLQQATTLDQYGRPFSQLMNLAITGTPTIEFQSDVIAVELDICNTGGMTFSPPLHITVYSDSGAVVQSIELPITLQPGDCEEFYLFIDQDNLEQFDNPYPLRIAINDNGEGTAQYGGLPIECDTADNYWPIDGSPCRMEIPNIITPNGDGYNDVWVPITMEGEFTELSLDIYNRWGKRVHHQETVDELSWDASDLSDGVYYCTIEYCCATTGRKKYHLHTSVTVIR